MPAAGPIPAYLLGNIWAQEWNNVYDLVAPATGGRGVALDAILKQRKTTAVDMAKYGERFFTSLGFRPIEGTPVTQEVYAELLRSHDDGVAEFLDLARVKPNTLGNTRMLLELG